MKKTIFAIAMCIAGVSAHAQRHYFADGDSWVYGNFRYDFELYYETGVPGYFDIIKEYIDGDTIVNGHNYWKVKARYLSYEFDTTGPTMEEREEECLLREDGKGRQYIFDKYEGRERLFYDFSKPFEVGSTCIVGMNIDYSDTVRIEKIEPFVLANGDTALMANGEILYGYGLRQQTGTTNEPVVMQRELKGFSRTSNGQVVMKGQNQKYIDIANDVFGFDVLKAVETGVVPKPSKIRTVDVGKEWKFVCDAPDGARVPAEFLTNMWFQYMGCKGEAKNLKGRNYGIINEKDKKVGSYDMSTTEKHPVLDFTLGVGDEFTRSDGKRLVVTAVRDTVPFDSLNITCKLMELRGVDDATLTDTWIEGIGSVHTGILPPEWFEGTGTPHLVSCTLGSGDKATFAVPETNGIEVVDAKETNNAPLYDLTGRRLVAPPTKGVYIEGGKKRVVR